ncbi:Dynein intermediate chain 3, ciliary [Araneus ventricosus]|uniref:Dynein intermediate chain 3, ciliary n=1 Tax=Araneus ventricosus TaxID=182803 RepID=A0A4Y2B6F6_ARAVE|nr:Dynein intermediate chain 3, ciliary [Araneus ventricosus]
MDISYIYTQKRKEFGKPCFFTDVGPHLLVDIDPDPEFQDEFYLVSLMDREVDNTKRYCAHEVNTVSYPTENRGMKHSEGGWPAGVDIEDEDSVTRFRKKIEKDKGYVNTIKSLADTVEKIIMENNSIDVYEEYFAGQRIKREDETDFQSVNVFSDPNRNARKVVDISWSEDSSKIAAAYSIDGLEIPVTDICLDSYVWDLENCLHPFCVLKPESCLNCLAFNPTSTDLLLGGYSSGQVALWDIRVGDRTQQLSSVKESHSKKVTGIKWIESSSRMDFFSASIDATVMSWDARDLSKPTETLILDPYKTEIPNLEELCTVNCVEYDPTLPDVFMLGNEQGKILKFSRKFRSDSEKLDASFDCEDRPILSIKRNAFFPQLFASCDPWSVKLWSEVTTGKPILNMMTKEGYYTDVDWNPARASMLFATKTTGDIEVWDIPGKHLDPITTIKLGKGALYCISADDEGKFLACGTVSGDINLQEVPGHFRKSSEEELNAVAMTVGSDELLEGKPRTKRLTRKQKKKEQEFKFEDLWDPPEKGEVLKEEYNNLYQKYPILEENAV